MLNWKKFDWEETCIDSLFLKPVKNLVKSQEGKNKINNIFHQIREINSKKIKIL